MRFLKSPRWVNKNPAGNARKNLCLDPGLLTLLTKWLKGKSYFLRAVKLPEPLVEFIPHKTETTRPTPLRPTPNLGNTSLGGSMS